MEKQSFYQNNKTIYIYSFNLILKLEKRIYIWVYALNACFLLKNILKNHNLFTKTMIIYALVAKGTLVLAEYT